MSNALVVLTVVFGFGAASVRFRRQQSPDEPSGRNVVAYNYDYAVEDEASKVFMSRWEERRGDYTRGEYAMLEPEGRYIRTVGYQVDSGHGFDARVYNVVPGTSLLSTQQFLKSLQIHPQRPLELDPIPPGESVDDTKTVNYHAMYHEKMGYHKMFPDSIDPHSNVRRGLGPKTKTGATNSR